MKTEQEKQKNKTEYEKPSLTADIVVLRHHYRFLQILLISRKNEPYRNCWALPGGFLEKGETIEECAVRECQEETGLKPDNLLSLGLFSESNRDPRGWIISNAFLSMSKDNMSVSGRDDAQDARWFTVFVAKDLDQYRLSVVDEHIVLKAVLKKKEEYGMTKFEVLENDGFAFDHAKIITAAILQYNKEF